MKSRILVFLTTLLAVTQVWAKTVTGSCSTNGSVGYSYDTSTKVLTISVKSPYTSGSIRNYQTSTVTPGRAPWYSDYRDKIEEVIIEEGVAGIGSNAFYSCSALKKVTIPSTVTQIGSSGGSPSGGAFLGCTALTDVYLNADPSSLTYYETSSTQRDFITSTPKTTICHVPIGYADSYYSSFKNKMNVTFSSEGSCGTNATYTYTPANKTLTISGTGAMTNYSWSGGDSYDNRPWKNVRDNITTVVVNNGITTVGNNAFSILTNLTSVTLPSTGLTSIGSYAFKGSSKIASISIPSSVSSIGSYAFYNCVKLKSITIPSGVTTIASSTFEGCSVLATVTIPSTVTSIGQYAFRNCTTLTSISIPESVTTIGASAFTECGLTSVIVPSGVTTLEECVFEWCTSLTSITLQEGLVNIDDRALGRCWSLTSITIPSTVRNIGSSTYSVSPFFLCTGMTDVYLNANPANLTWRNQSSEAFITETPKTTRCHVPYSYYDSYVSNFSSVNVTFVQNSPTADDIFTISYTLNGGTVSPANPTNYNVTTTTFTLRNPTKTGYTFAGWTGSNGSTPQTTVTIAKGSVGNKSYTANWTANTYTVTLNKQSGTGGSSSVTATYNAAMPAITVPTRTGYTFGGYYTSTGGSGTQYYTSTGASARNWDKTSATTLYAKWTANTYTVTLDKQSGTGGSNSVTATYGFAMPSATMPTRAHYTFGGYYTSTGGSGTQYYTSAGASARNWDKTSATTLYAKWTACPTATVTAPTAKTLTYTGTSQALVNAGSASGGTLQYKLGSGSWGTSIPTTTAAGTYTVYYRVVADDSHTDNAGSSVSVTISKATLTCKADNKSVTYGANPPTYTATYSGWKNSETSSVLSGTLSYSCTYAKGSNAGSYTITPSGVTATNYAITFQTGTLTVNKAASSVTAAPTAKSLVYNGSSQTLINAGTASGGTMNYSLDNSSWSSSLPTATTAGEYTVYYKVVGDGNHNDTSVSSITVYIDYTIGYDLDGGSLTSANPTRYNVTTNSFTLNNPTRDGYTFAGWTGTGLASATTTVTITKGSTGNMSYTATWTKNEVTLTDGEDISALSAFAGLQCEVNYSRSFTISKPSTVCLPFAYTKKMGDGSFYEFTGIEKEDGNYVATMTEPAGSTLTANTPYLYMPTTTGSMDFSGTYTIPEDLTIGLTTSGDWTFVGTYETVSWTEAPTGIYGFSAQNVDAQGISQGEFVKVGAYVRVRPMRCYLRYKDGSEDYAGARGMNSTTAEALPKTISVRLVNANGEVTAIGTLHTQTGEVTLDGWYTLDGTRLLNKPIRKGIYVHHGKKVIIK